MKRRNFLRKLGLAVPLGGAAALAARKAEAQEGPDPEPWPLKPKKPEPVNPNGIYIIEQHEPRAKLHAWDSEGENSRPNQALLEFERLNYAHGIPIIIDGVRYYIPVRRARDV